MRRSDPPARILELLALLLGVLAAGSPAPALADVVYQHDFETPAGAEWSHSAREVTPSGRGLLGQFGNDTVTLRLQDLPAHSTVSVSFDLFVLRSWDGSGENGWGPDVWSASVEGGPTLLQSTFSYPGCIINRQAFPAPYGRGLFLGGTGACEMNSLGYTFRFPTLTAPLDAVYLYAGRQNRTRPLAGATWGLSICPYPPPKAEIAGGGTIAESSRLPLRACRKSRPETGNASATPAFRHLEKPEIGRQNRKRRRGWTIHPSSFGGPSSFAVIDTNPGEAYNGPGSSGGASDRALPHGAPIRRRQLSFRIPAADSGPARPGSFLLSTRRNAAEPLRHWSFDIGHLTLERSDRTEWQVN